MRAAIAVRISSRSSPAGATDERLFDTIRKGVPGTEMPAQGLDMSDNDILQIISYLRNLGSVAAPETPIGNAEHGQQLFAQQCTTCHRVGGAGGRLGPDLSRIGAQRSRAALTREIRTPSEWMAPVFETVTLVTKDGQRIRGVKKAEDVFSIQIMDTRERLQGYLKANLQEVIHEKNSLMPTYGPAQLSDADLKDVLGYLATLRGANPSPAPAAAAPAVSIGHHAGGSGGRPQGLDAMADLLGRLQWAAPQPVDADHA